MIFPRQGKHDVATTSTVVVMVLQHAPATVF